jgi:hypothetical protein
VSGCCNRRGCDDFFGDRFARRVAKRYRKRGLDKTSRRIVGFLERAGLEGATVLEIGGVVCCYPYYARLLGAAASHARRALVFSHPPRNLASRAFIRLQNLGLRLAGKQFRAFAHPPEAMLDVCRAHGLSPAFAHPGAVWEVQGLSR